MFYLIGLLIAIFLIIYYFAAKQLNPVPYFPTNTKDIKRITNLIKLKNNQTVIDLGAGDGKIILELAKIAENRKINTQFIAIDINLFLILTMYTRRFFRSNKKNIKIIWGDFFKLDYKKIIGGKKEVTIYLYLAPWLNNAIGNLLKKMKFPLHVISYYYPIKNLKLTKKIKGEHDIFVYHIK